MEVSRILIYGFGRMGLTHFSILNKLITDKEFHVVESNKKLRLLLGKNLNVTFHKDDKYLNQAFDYVLITTPPFAHLNLLKKCINRGDKIIFVEKPFGGHLNSESILDQGDSQIFVGYVLRFNPCVAWVKNNLKVNEIASVSGQYLSNTISKKPQGWRNGPYSGVLNEMGSHVIDLLTYIIEDSDLTVVESEYESVYSDVDDILKANLRSSKNIPVSLYLNWVDKKVRKPVFKLRITMLDGTYYNLDQQTIEMFSRSDELIQKVSVTDLLETVPFYLRGIDFTKQMQSLVGERKRMASMLESIEVNKIMNQILSK